MYIQTSMRRYTQDPIDVKSSVNNILEYLIQKTQFSEYIFRNYTILLHNFEFHILESAGFQNNPHTIHLLYNTCNRKHNPK